MGKRGSYKKHKANRFGTQKTTSKKGKREYQKRLMRKRRGTAPSRFGVRGRKPRAVTVASLSLELKRLDKSLRELG